MKKKIYIFLLAYYVLPIVMVTSLLFIRHLLLAGGRKYEAMFDRVGWHMEMKEQRSDSLLFFAFQKMGKEDNGSISFYIENNYCSDVISFIVVEGVDTVYIRKELEFKELFPPEEQYLHPVAPKDFSTSGPFVGKLPSNCKMVAFSDPRFFVYDKNKCTYILKDDMTHIFKLFHNTERGDAYSLFDIAQKDTTEIKAIRID